MNLIDFYFSTPIDPYPWRIYDRHTRRKLSDDYGAELADEYYDSMRVWEIKLKTSASGDKYYRVTVY